MKVRTFSKIVSELLIAFAVYQLYSINSNLAEVNSQLFSIRDYLSEIQKNTK